MTLAVNLIIVESGAELIVRGTVRNHANESAAIDVWRSRLLVNGEPSDAWAWAIANGIRPEDEFTLPSDGAVSFERRLPMSSVLPERGRYQLVLEVAGVRSESVTTERT